MHLHMHWTQTNWGGMLFVAIIFPLSGLTTILLRRWADNAETNKEPTDVWVAQRLSDPDYEPGRWKVRTPANALDSSEYRPSDHVHIFDATRSPQVTVSDAGTRISCAYPGCEETKFTARDVSVWVGRLNPSEWSESEREW